MMTPQINVTATSHPRSSQAAGAPLWLRMGLALACVAALSGCAAVVVGAAATTAMVVADRRSAGEQVDDKSIQLKVGNAVRGGLPENSRVNTSSYGGDVLLTGDVPTEADRARAQSLASQVDGVKRVVNQLRVGDVTPLSVRTNDTWIASKVRTALINAKEVPTRTINVTVERGVVYLQGRLTAAEGERAVYVASRVEGVNQVGRLFQTVSPDSLNDRMEPAEQAAAEPAPPTAAPAASGVQVMPVN